MQQKEEKLKKENLKEEENKHFINLLSKNNVTNTNKWHISRIVLFSFFNTKNKLIKKLVYIIYI